MPVPLGLLGECIIHHRWLRGPSTRPGLPPGSPCVYTSWYIRKKDLTTARLFKSGNSLAVRLPKAFRLRGKEVEIFRRGDEVVLREKGKGMARAFDLLAELPSDVLPERQSDGPPQSRKGR